MVGPAGVAPASLAYQARILLLNHEPSEFWSDGRESNPRDPPWQGGAWPLGYRRMKFSGWGGRGRTCVSGSKGPRPTVRRRPNLVGVEGFEPPSLSAADLQSVELVVPDLLSTPRCRIYEADPARPCRGRSREQKLGGPEGSRTLHTLLARQHRLYGTCRPVVGHPRRSQ